MARPLRPSFHLRQADEEDREDVLAADAACFPDDARPAWEGAAWWVLEAPGGEVAAYCAARPAYSTPGAAYLSRAGVLPAFRGLGLQRRLVRVRERWARAHGFYAMVTDTRGNAASSNTLIRCGYRLWEPDAPWSYDDASYWYRVLRV